MHEKVIIENLTFENEGPKDLGGSGNIAGPMQLLLASLANCLEITALVYLSFSNVQVQSVKVKVEALYAKISAINPRKEPFPGFYDITYVWYVEKDERFKKVDQILRRVEELCPVKGTCNRHYDFQREIQLIKTVE